MNTFKNTFKNDYCHHSDIHIFLSVIIIYHFDIENQLNNESNCLTNTRMLLI